MSYQAVCSMDAMPEMAAGSWASNIIVNMLLTALDAKFPGLKDFVLKYSDYLPLTKVWAAIQLAMLEWQQGKDFLTILQDEINQWLTPDQIRMMAGN